MAKIRAYVYKDSGFIDSYKVYPPVVVLTKNDQFELVNTTDDEAVLQIPEGAFEGGGVDEKIRKHSKSNAKTPRNVPPLAVEYQVTVKGKKATAHSDPVIIIDP